MGKRLHFTALIRRVVRHGRLIGIAGKLLTKLQKQQFLFPNQIYPNLRQRETAIKAELQREEVNFLKTLDRGEKLLAEIIQDIKQKGLNSISGESAFTLYDTYGFPLELTQEVAEENNITVDVDGFNAEMQKQVDGQKQHTKQLI
jgi:alanyl-tRNA synthetase